MNLKTPDAIHAVTALLSDSALFVTNDSAFRRISDLKVVILSEEVSPDEENEANSAIT